MITDLVQIQRLGEKKVPENEKFRRHIHNARFPALQFGGGRSPCLVFPPAFRFASRAEALLRSCGLYSCMHSRTPLWCSYRLRRTVLVLTKAQKL